MSCLRISANPLNSQAGDFRPNRIYYYKPTAYNPNSRGRVCSRFKLRWRVQKGETRCLRGNASLTVGFAASPAFEAACGPTAEGLLSRAILESRTSANDASRRHLGLVESEVAKLTHHLLSFRSLFSIASNALLYCRCAFRLRHHFNLRTRC